MEQNISSFSGRCEVLELLNRTNVQGAWIDIICYELEQNAEDHSQKLIDATRAELERDSSASRILLYVVADLKLADAYGLFAELLDSPDETLRPYGVNGLKLLDTKESRRLLWEYGNIGHSGSENSPHDPTNAGYRGRYPAKALTHDSKSTMDDQIVHDRWAKLGYDNLLPEERDYVTIWWLVAEVHNGAFEQYYHNETGNHAFQALEALKLCGAKEVAIILQQALEIMQPVGGYTRDQDARYDRIEKLESATQSEDDLFHSATDAFYETEEPILELAMNRVRSAYTEHGVQS